ncbi:MAG: hypothetical protein COA67_05725 [Lutibacter sp.]|nr:MAG: hypothetical protein COA67_05725 [Lutibacter sp.]
MKIAVDKTKGFTSISSVCKCFNLKRDAFYKYNRRVNQRHVFEQQIIDVVKKRRKSLPREGVRKLMKSLNSDFEKQQLNVGRDTLFKILREHKMLTLRKKYSARTTNSYHRFYKYNNIIKDLEITRPNQVWASDITYIRTLKGFCYLALITDMYSRKIVGYDLSDSLELNGCVRAFNKAVYQTKNIKGLISSFGQRNTVLQQCIHTNTQKKKNKHKYDRRKSLL